MKTTEEFFDEVANYLAGTCSMTSVESSMLEVAAYEDKGRVIASEDVENFEKYLEKIEITLCDECGWWSHPGETCECIEDMY